MKSEKATKPNKLRRWREDASFWGLCVLITLVLNLSVWAAQMVAIRWLDACVVTADRIQTLAFLGMALGAFYGLHREQMRKRGK